MAKIQIFTVHGKNSALFSDFLYDNMTALSSGQHELEFNCFMSAQKDPPASWNHLESILKQEHTSLNHTIGLNRALNYMDGDYVICCDTDIALLQPDWDQYLINELIARNIHILGIGHAPISRGYQNFPIVTFFIARTSDYTRVRPDLRPDMHQYPNHRGIGAREVLIESEEEAAIFGKEVGSELLRDSGWQLPLIFKRAGLKGDVFKSGKPYIIEYVPQIWEFGETWGLCHKGKGSKRRQSQVREFHRSVARYIQSQYGVELAKYLRD